MKLSIYSLKNILFQGSATSLNCQTAMGEITILDNHEAMIGVLSAGVIRIVTAEKPDKSQRHFDGPVTIPPKADLVGEQFFQVKSGFLEIKPGNEVRCIVEQ